MYSRYKEHLYYLVPALDILKVIKKYICFKPSEARQNEYRVYF